MKRVLINVAVVAALSLSLISAVATMGNAQKTKSKASTPKTVTGFISDSSCGLQHMAGMNEKDCTLMCAKNGKFVLADRDQKVVYQLDSVGQEKAREFAGQKVKITGRVSGKTIRVTANEAAA